jgi:hypothetical protein
MPAKNLQVVAALLPLALILAGPDPLPSPVPYRTCRGYRQEGKSKLTVQCAFLYQNLLRIRGGGGGIEGTGSEGMAHSGTSGLRKNGQKRNEPHYMHVSDILAYIHESNLPPSPWQTRGKSNNITIKPLLSEANMSHMTHTLYDKHPNATNSAKAEYIPVQYPPLCSEEWKLQESKSIKWRSMPSVVGWFRRCAAVTCVLLVQDSVLVMCKDDDKEGEMWDFPTIYVSSDHACFAHVVAPKFSEMLGFKVTMKERMPMSTCASLHTQSLVFECEPDIDSKDIRSHVLRRALKSLPQQTEIAWVSPEGIGSLLMNVRNRLVRIGYWQRQAEIERAPMSEKELMRVHDTTPTHAPSNTRASVDVSNVASHSATVQNFTMRIGEDATEEEEKAELDLRIHTHSPPDTGKQGYSAGMQTKTKEPEHDKSNRQEKDSKDRYHPYSTEQDKDRKEHDACVTAQRNEANTQGSARPDRSELWSAARRDQASTNDANQRLGGLDRSPALSAARGSQTHDNKAYQPFVRYGSGNNQKGTSTHGNFAPPFYNNKDTRMPFQKANSLRGSHLNTGTGATYNTNSASQNSNSPRSPQSNKATPATYGQSNTYNKKKTGMTRPQSQSYAATDSTSRDPHAGVIGKLAYLLSVPPHKLCSALTTATQHQHLHSRDDSSPHDANVETSTPEAKAIESGGLLDVVESAVKGRRLATRHLRTQREFIAHGLIRIPADALSFARAHTESAASAAHHNTSTVADYFRSKYAPLRYPGLPCVVSYIQPRASTYMERQPKGDHDPKSESASHPTVAYYPLEVLDMLDDMTADKRTHGFDIEDEYLLGTYDEQGVPSASLRGAWQPCDEDPLEGGWVPISAVRLNTGDDGSVQSIEIPREKECALNQTTWDAWMRERHALNNGGNNAEPNDDDDGDQDSQQAARDSLWKFAQSQMKAGKELKELSELSSSLEDGSYVSDSDSETDRSDARMMKQNRPFKKPVPRHGGKHAVAEVEENEEMLCASKIDGGRDALRKLWQAQGETTAKGVMPVGGPEVGEDGRLTQQGGRMVENMLKRVVQRGAYFQYFCA